MDEYSKFLEELLEEAFLEKKILAKAYSEMRSYSIAVKKEIAYAATMEEEISPEIFLKACQRYLGGMSEDVKKIVSPALRDLKLKLLNI